MNTTRHKPARRGQAFRQDGLATRQQLLQSAGEVFAEHGYAKATSKEICARANANIAAVNYHFGSKEELYASVLEEAHSHLVSIEAVAAAAQSRVDPRTKLSMFIGHIVGEITRRESNAWELRVLSRELLSPSPMISRMISNQVVPKVKLFSTMVAEILQLPVEHPAVSRSIVNVMGPCIFLLITSRTLQQKVLPNLNLTADSLTEHMVTFALAGMQAVAHEARSAAADR